MQPLKKGVVLRLHISDALYQYCLEALNTGITADENIPVDVFIDTDEAQFQMISLITKGVVGEYSKQVLKQRLAII